MRPSRNKAKVCVPKPSWALLAPIGPRFSSPDKIRGEERCLISNTNLFSFRDTDSMSLRVTNHFELKEIPEVIDRASASTHDVAAPIRTTDY